MLNNNYYAIIGGCFVNKTLTLKKASDGSNKVINRNSLHMELTSPNVAEGANDGAGIFALLGSGTTPATLEDYKLESALSMTAPNNSLSILSKKGSVLTYVRTFHNAGSEPVTVNELGMYACMSDYNFNAMFAREVFDKPIVIEPGASKTFTFVLK